MNNLNTEKRLVWRQDSHAATVRPFGCNSHELVWRPSPGISCCRNFGNRATAPPSSRPRRTWRLPSRHRRATWLRPTRTALPRQTRSLLAIGRSVFAYPFRLAWAMVPWSISSLCSFALA